MHHSKVRELEAHKDAIRLLTYEFSCKPTPEATEKAIAAIQNANSDLVAIERSIRFPFMMYECTNAT